MMFLHKRVACKEIGYNLIFFSSCLREGYKKCVEINFARHECLFDKHDYLNGFFRTQKLCTIMQNIFLLSYLNFDQVKN